MIALLSDKAWEVLPVVAMWLAIGAIFTAANWPSRGKKGDDE